MFLKSVRIENFKSIEDSTEFGIDDVTCLVGKNEAGKTALLEALYKIKPVEVEKADFKEGEFPRRHLATYRQRQEREPANVLTTVWILEDEDIAEINTKIEPASLGKTEVILKKGYDNKLVWEFLIDDLVLLEEYIDGANFNAAEKSQISKATSIRELDRIMKSIDGLTEKQSALQERLTTDFADGDPILQTEKILHKRLPHFLYFSNYDQLPGRVAIDDIKDKKAHNRLGMPQKIFLSLLDMTSTGIDEIEGIAQLDKLIMELESVEASLTDEIKEYWSQNQHLEVDFIYTSAKPGDPPPLNSGYVFDIRIKNTRHRATVNFDERSHGFIWFFSFLVWFSQVKRQYGDNLLILLDDPGLPLHGRAQQDLIRYINERLKPIHQVIYTAHSPFLIDGKNIFSLRTVEDVVSVTQKEGEDVEVIEGTKVGQRILSRDKDTIFPLQGVLGFDLAQTLFVGPNVVVVEGPTEYAVFEWFSRELVKQGKKGLDIRWAVCPAEGAAKISSFVSLFSGRGMRIAVFTDYHEGQKGMIDRLEESGLLPEGHIVKTSEITGKAESDIEDVIGRQLYINLVNGAVGLTGQHCLPDKKPTDALPRVVKEVEAHCRLLPPGYPAFGHYLPIEYLLKLSEDEISKLPGLDEAIRRFETIFDTLNNLIDGKKGQEDDQSSADEKPKPLTE